MAVDVEGMCEEVVEEFTRRKVRGSSRKSGWLEADSPSMSEREREKVR